MADRPIPAALRSAYGSRATHVRGGSGDPDRGGWCTPKWLAEAVGRFDLDPFSNPRSHIASDRRCMLEDGGDGFGRTTIGSYFWRQGPNIVESTAAAETHVWLQPPYSKGFVARAFEHYQRTRWTALLRFDPRPSWFDMVYDAAELVCVIRSAPAGKPFGFEPPPGVTPSSNSFPHALFYRDARDVTDAVLEHAIAWRKKPR